MPAPIITERRVRGMFFEALMQSTGLAYVEAISTPIMDSDQDTEKYAWIGMVPQLSPKNGVKTFDQLRATTWDVANVEYQGGIRIPKKHVLYDKTGQIRVRVAEMARRAKAHWVTVIAPLIVNGESTVCYDGQFFFDDDHSEGDSGSQSNDITADISGFPVATHGIVTQPSPMEFIYSVMAGIEAMLAFKDDQGEYVNEDKTEFLVLTGTVLLTNALAGLNATRLDGGNSNFMLEQDNFTIRLAASPRFDAWTDKFAIFATQGDQQAIIRQQRIPNNNVASGFDMDGLEYTSLWLDSEYCQLNDEVLINIETERAAAYGDWKKAMLVKMI